MTNDDDFTPEEIAELEERLEWQEGCPDPPEPGNQQEVAWEGLGALGTAQAREGPPTPLQPLQGPAKAIPGNDGTGKEEPGGSGTAESHPGPRRGGEVSVRRGATGNLPRRGQGKGRKGATISAAC